MLKALVCNEVPRLLLSVTVQGSCGARSAEEGEESTPKFTMGSRNIDHTSCQELWDPCFQLMHAVCCRHQGTRAWIHPSWPVVAAAKPHIVQ